MTGNSGAAGFAELAEAAAPEPIAAIYREIRYLSGVPMVALIFRHLATYPGVLEQVWQTLQPLFASGRLQEAAWTTAENHIPADLLPPIEAPARAVIGLDGPALTAVLDTLQAYNRANPVNLMAMLCLLARLEDNRAPAEPLPQRVWSPPEAIAGPLPPMTPPAAMTPAVRRLIQDFGFSDRSQPDPVVPSLFRHFTDMPALLAILHVMLVPRFRDDSLARAVTVMHRAMRSEAALLAEQLALLPDLNHYPGVRAAMERFSSSLIPQMIIIGFALHRALSRTAGYPVYCKASL
jgi:hypothetical protein